MERKAFTAIEVKVVEGQPGTVEAIVSVSKNEDFGGDVVQPGAFLKFIGDVKTGIWAKWPTLLWNHGVDLGLAAVTGKVTDMEELQPGDARLPAKLLTKGYGGLKIRAQYNLKTQPGREAYEHVLAGDVADWSFMYEAPDTEVDAKGRRLLKQIYPVYECSNVLIGMNPETVTLGVKSMADLLAKPAKKEALKAEVVDILEQVEGALNAPETEHKGDPLPVMTGEEAFHQQAFDDARKALNALIAQELSEDSTEYDDVIWLASIANSLASWANQENAEDGPPKVLDGDASPSDVYGMGSGLEPETKDQSINLENILAFMKTHLVINLIETPVSSPQPNVPDDSDEADGLTSWARRRTRLVNPTA